VPHHRKRKSMPLHSLPPDLGKVRVVILEAWAQPIVKRTPMRREDPCYGAALTRRAGRLIAGEMVASRGDFSAPVISEAVEAAVRIVEAAEAAVAARHSSRR
jgi:hypothetical protein